MCYLYTCGACERGDHEKCEIGYGDGKSFGGGHCVCRCNGRSEKKWAEDDKVAREMMIKNMVDHERRKADHPTIHIGEIGKTKRTLASNIMLIDNIFPMGGG